MRGGNGNGEWPDDTGKRQDWHKPRPLTQDEEDQAQEDAYRDYEKEQAKKPVRVLGYRLPDDEAIPRRQWIASGLLLRKCVTAIVAAGAGGKSLFMIGLALHLAAGRNFGRFKIKQQYRVAILSVEEERDELDRRVAAAARHYGISREQIAGHFYIVGMQEPPTLAVANKNGTVRETDKNKAMQNELMRLNIDIVICDPLVELWQGSENDNGQMAGVLTIFRDTARRMNGAVLLAHHARKGEIQPGDADASRGGSALVGVARFAFTLTPMSEKEAEDMKVSAEIRLKYARLTSAKANYLPRSSDSDWFEWHDYQIENGDENEVGDRVGVLAPWVKEQPRAGADIGKADRAESVFLDLLRWHAKNGINVSANSQAKNYAPLVFAAHPKSQKIGKNALVDAMVSLIDEGRVAPKEYTANGKPAVRLEVA